MPLAFCSSGVSGRTATPSLPFASASSDAFAILPSSSVPTVAASSTVLPSRHTSTATFVPGAVLPMRLVELGAVGHRDAVDLADHVAGLEACLGSRAVLLDVADERAVRVGQAEALRKRLVHALDADAEATMLDLAVRLQLVGDLGRDIGRNGKRQAHVAARTAVDLRVHADDLARGVEQRSARVARIHGDVGLDERHHLTVGQRTMHAAHDTGGHAVLEAERRADGNRPLAAPHRRLGIEVERRQFLASILMSAMSVRLSLPMTLAMNSRRSVSLTVTSLAPSTTCALVTM